MHDLVIRGELVVDGSGGRWLQPHRCSSPEGRSSRLEGIEQVRAEGASLFGHFPPRAVGNVLQWRVERQPCHDAQWGSWNDLHDPGQLSRR